MDIAQQIRRLSDTIDKLWEVVSPEHRADLDRIGYEMTRENAAAVETMAKDYVV